MKRQHTGIKMKKKDRRNVVNGGAFGTHKVPTLYGKSNGHRVRPTGQEGE